MNKEQFPLQGSTEIVEHFVNLFEQCGKDVNDWATKAKIGFYVTDIARRSMMTGHYQSKFTMAERTYTVSFNDLGGDVWKCSI